MWRTILGAALVMAMYSFVWASYIASSSVFIAKVVDAESRGTAMGLTSSSFALASIASNVVLGPGVEVLGYKHLFKAVSATLLITCIATLVTLRHLQRRAAEGIRGGSS